MSGLSKALKKIGNSLKKLPGKVLSGKPLITGVFNKVPVIGGALGKVEQTAGISSNVLNLLGSNKPKFATKLQALEAKGGQVTAAAFGAGALVGLTKGADVGLKSGDAIAGVDTALNSGVGNVSGFGNSGGFGAVLNDISGVIQTAEGIVASGTSIYQNIKGGKPAPAPGVVYVQTPAPATSAQSSSSSVAPLAIAAAAIVGTYFLFKKK